MEIDKEKLKQSLLKIKNEEEDCQFDYIAIDIKKSEAYGEVYDYEYSYDEWGNEVDKWIVKVEDSDTVFIFDKDIIYKIEEFTNSIEQLIKYRIRADAAFAGLLSYAQDVVEEYEYNHKYYAQIAWNIKDGKIYKRSFYNEDKYEDNKIENNPFIGVFALNVEEFIEEKCSFVKEEGYEVLDGYYTNEKKIRAFVFGATAQYNNYDEWGLLYPEELLDYLFSIEDILTQDSEENEEKEIMKKELDTTVGTALKGYRCTIKKSLNSTYEETSIPILYLALDRLFHEQDYLVASKSVAEAYLSKASDDDRKKFLSRCTVSYSKEADCWGITMPQTSVTIAEYHF